jgi:predicted TIM-barrel fold metal-dependent hydrolase
MREMPGLMTAKSIMLTANENPSRRQFLKHCGAGLSRGALAGTGLKWTITPNVDETTQTNKTPVLDCHAHAGTATGMTDPWTCFADPEAILRRNREAGIDQSVLFPINHDTFEEANREIAQICRRFPGKFIGYAKHDPNTEKGRIRSMLFHECRELGLRGLKLHVHPGPEVLDAVAELGIPILYHPQRVAQFEEIAKSYPKVDLILAHLGSDQSIDWREHVAAIEIANKYPNIYLDTGATVLSRFIEQAIREVGAEKILFGSDEPEVDCRQELYKIRVLKLPKVQEELILGGNLLRLLSKYKGGSV